jgi:hypothetical protein
MALGRDHDFERDAIGIVLAALSPGQPGSGKAGPCEWRPRLLSRA